MTINQLSIFIENKEGKLADLTSTLAREGIDIRAMSVADTRDFGILRLIVNDTDRAVNVLKESGCIVSVTQVLAVSLEDTPGSLAKVMRILSDNHISVEYVYAFITISKKNACVVLRVGDNDKATEILEGAGIKVLTEDYVKSI